jgi:transportin-3
LDQLEAYIVNVKSLDTLPPSCIATPEAIYAILENLLEKYASSYGIAEKATRLLRRGLAFFPWSHIQALVPRILARMMTCFEVSGHSSYIWLIDRTVALFGERLAVLAGSPEGSVLETSFSAAFERMTTQVKTLETQQDATQIPDSKRTKGECEV